MIVHDSQTIIRYYQLSSGWSNGSKKPVTVDGSLLLASSVRHLQSVNNANLVPLLSKNEFFMTEEGSRKGHQRLSPSIKGKTTDQIMHVIKTIIS